MRSNKIHQLEQLEEEHCWQLFSKHAFRDKNDPQINLNFEKIGKKIMNKCQGLPLALEAIGSLLNKKSSLLEWERLLSRKYKNHFVIHGLLHDLAKYVCGNFGFKLNDKEAQSVSKMTSHFHFLCEELESSKRLKTLYNANRLQTFLPLSMNSYQNRWLLVLKSNKLMLSELLSKLKLLRVLSLKDYWDMVEFPDTIGDLKHLRHLDLSRTRIKKLPDSLCSLYKLQILKLEDCEYFEEFPMDLHKLVNLFYLDLSRTKVRKMPKEMGKLKNLEVLSSFYVEKSSDSNIQQLGELDLHGKLSVHGRILRGMDQTYLISLCYLH